MNDEMIRELLTDAVSDVEPGHRLSEIQARTVKPDRRPRWYVAGGAVLATAAAVTTFAVVTNLGGDDGTDPDPAPTGPPTTIDTRAVAAYYIGETPNGLRLYREFAKVDATIPMLEASLNLLETGPADPDYTTAWGPDSFVGASVQGDVINVDLADESLHDRPAGMSSSTAELAIEQVIFTAQAALGKGMLPVQFRLNGNPINEVFGEPTNEPVGNRPNFDVQALVNISDPTEGQTVSGTFIAEGVINSFEANVPWEIRNADESVVSSGFTTADGWEGGKLYPWKVEIDVSDLEPGRYTFVASTDDPSGGSEGPGASSDTRTIVVE